MSHEVSFAAIPNSPLRFRCRRQGWAHYETEDGVEGTTTFVALLVSELPVSGQVGLSGPTLTSVWAPTALRGPPGPQLTRDSFRSAVSVPFRETARIKSEYVVMDGGRERFFTVDLVVTDVRRVRRLYDPVGMPALMVANSLAVSPLREMRPDELGA